MAGKLYLVATPIGNLEDMTLRGLNTLKSVDIIACEDTRHTKKLLNHFNIHTPTTSYHQHNKLIKGEKLIALLLEGKSIALVTDAGTPGISDPGEDLVKLCHENNVTVAAVPGAVAAITSLIISGLSTRYFVFEGFLPTDKKSLKERLELLKDETRTIIIYEAPHRLKQTITNLYEKLGDRTIAITRELTKKHEEVKKITLGQAVELFKTLEPKGEYVLIVEGKDIKELKKETIDNWKSYTIKEHMDIYLSQGMTKKDAMKKVAKDRGVAKREIYNELEKEK